MSTEDETSTTETETTEETENIPQPNPAEARLLDALSSIIENASSPEIAEAQLILLRRLALQGDVINSRIPAPLNITEVGGYINLLDTKNQSEMQAQMLAGVLGVAGPNPPFGWLSTKPKLIMIPVANDRPECPAQPSIPIRVTIRSDFLPDINAALKTIHDQHCTLPLLNTFQPLPPSTASQENIDPLPYLGRTLTIVPTTALRDPTSDPIALAKPQGTDQPYQPVARVLKPESSITPTDWEAYQCDQNSCTAKTITNAKYLPLNPILANAGFYPQNPDPTPQNQNSTNWTTYTNITGLIPKITTLGTELTLLHTPADIAQSIFAPRLNWTWNGQEFTPP
ncbi:MAG: hypothetical protein NWF04_02385 [Candidatus Bathyarchaeota archaeon]|nr:hypothetical protein [Candidatus Bathyarchaeota archaeon]